MNYNYTKLTDKAVADSVSDSDKVIVNVNGAVKQATVKQILSSVARKDQISNPNLLDNPFFNVNSRGILSGGTNGKYNYCVDRWLMYANSMTPTFTIDNNGITIHSEIEDGVVSDDLFRLMQHLSNSIDNDFYTFSIYVDTPSIAKSIGIYLIDSKGEGIELIPNIVPENSQSGIYSVTFKPDTRTKRIYIENYAKVTIKAVKFEKGSISTLHLDSAPDIEQERLKCMLSTADATDTYANKGALTEDLWNSTKTYAVGDYCIYNGTLWRCLVQHSGVEPVEGTTWTATSIQTELNRTLKIVSFDSSSGTLVTKSV